MNLKEVLEFLKTAKDSEESKEFIAALLKEHAAPVTLDAVKPLFDTDPAFKQFLSTIGDSRVQSALKTYEEKTLPTKLSEREAELRKILQPKETEEQKQIRELKDRLDKAERDNRRATLRSKVLSLVNSKKLPEDFVDLLLDEDEEKTTTRANGFFTKYEESVAARVKEEVDKRFKAGGGTPRPDDVDDPSRKKKEDDDKKSDSDFLKDKLKEKKT